MPDTTPTTPPGISVEEAKDLHEVLTEAGNDSEYAATYLKLAQALQAAYTQVEETGTFLILEFRINPDPETTDDSDDSDSDEDEDDKD